MKTKWMLEYGEGPQFTLPGWQLKHNNDVKRPIGVITEPRGGMAPRDAAGRQIEQKKAAMLISVAPELLEALQSLLDVSGGSVELSDWPELQEARMKAEEVIEWSGALDV